MKNLKRIGGTAMVVAVLVAAQPALAASTLQFTGFSQGSVDVNISSVPAAIVTHDSAGAYGTILNGMGPSFDTLCIDVWQYLNFSTNPAQYSVGAGQTYQYTNNLVGYATDGGSGVTINQNTVDNFSRLYNEVQSTGGYTNATKSAALQLAVWEVAYDTKPTGATTYDLTSGNFYSPVTSGGADQAVLDQANTWLGGLGGYSKSAYSVFAYTSTTNQDVIGFTAAVPEPETYAMLLAGLGLMVFMVRRGKQQHAT